DQPRRNSVERGILGGILGGVDMLILPFTGPADAIGMLEGSLPAAEIALDRLLSFGSRRASREEAAQDEEGTEVTEAEGTVEEEQSGEEEETSGSVAAGGLAGGVIGAVGAALLLPGVGLAIAGGALTMAIIGAVVGGITGGFLDALVRLGVPRDRARHYEQEFQAGRILLVIKPATPAQEQLAHDILRQYGAHEVTTHSTDAH
ncbi:MAG TPA: hypothetical protein VH593_09125, partial [Ktedonobacteraceae bacterium]